MPFNLLSKLRLNSSDLYLFQRRLIITLTLLITFITWGLATGNFSKFYSAVQPKNQPYTELYFNNISELPTSIPNTDVVSFSFTIHNVEGSSDDDWCYYSVEIGETPQVIKKQLVFLANNQFKTIDVRLAILPSTQEQKVIVSLPRFDQSIDFWLKGSS